MRPAYLVGCRTVSVRVQTVAETLGVSSMMGTYVRGTRSAVCAYDEGVEQIGTDEQSMIDAIIEAMMRGGEVTRTVRGRAVRISHPEAHGLLDGEMRVQRGMPRHLAQGLF